VVAEAHLEATMWMRCGGGGESDGSTGVVTDVMWPRFFFSTFLMRVSR
jgi:hypothetical protein